MNKIKTALWCLGVINIIYLVVYRKRNRDGSIGNKMRLFSNDIAYGKVFYMVI